MTRAASLRLFFLLLASARVWAAREDPVSWAFVARPDEVLPGREATGFASAPGQTIYLFLRAVIQPGWHLYSPTTPPGGPIITKIRVGANPALTGATVYRPTPTRKLDNGFNIETETYAATATFPIAVTLRPDATGEVPVQATVRYQACSDTKCLNPVSKTESTRIAVRAGAPAGRFSIGDRYQAVPGSGLATAEPAATAPTQTQPPTQVPQPVIGDRAGLVPFLLAAFLGGLAAVFTPCVFPMIPITVSFFLNQGGAVQSKHAQRARPWVQAAVFCGGIVALFTGLGLLATAVAGPFGVAQLGSNIWVNSFIALVFVVFALSLLGLFELRLPSGLLTRLDAASQGSGFVPVLLMGLTFALTSFACIGPIVGPLLVASVQSKGAQPIMGMAAFATGLAAPFFLLAAFPSYLQRLPRSGGWLARVKIVLGFVVLAAALKYLASVDQVLQANFLTRERFLAAWIVLFAMPGLYLLGFLRLEGIKPGESLGVGRALAGAAFLMFAISLLPGLFGAALGDLDAYVPVSATPATTLASASATASGSTPRYYKNQLETALAAARRDNKLVLINFTGYACTNCHWMKANIFTKPEIRAELDNMIVVDLFTDGTDAESQKNQKFEDQKFGTASIPFYVLMDGEHRVLATFPQLTRNPAEFLAFLQKRPAASAEHVAMLR